MAEQVGVRKYAAARTHRGEARRAQKRREGVRRMQNFPRISRINEKCQIFRCAARGVRHSPGLYFLYFTVPPDAARLGAAHDGKRR